jgi:hypothetical protein
MVSVWLSAVRAEAMWRQCGMTPEPISNRPFMYGSSDKSLKTICNKACITGVQLAPGRQLHGSSASM